MDTLTHSMLGAVAARTGMKNRVDKSCLIVAAVAAAFPDIDYLLFWVNPYKFITEWHRGVTHSVLMLPLWAGLISAISYKFMRGRIPFIVLFGFSSLGLLTHLTADMITLYGIQLLSPVSSRRFALSITFDMDPWIGLMASLSLIFGYFKRSVAVIGLFLIAAYLLILSYFQFIAIKTAETRLNQSGIFGSRAYALPQPFFPFHWKLAIDHNDHYELAHLSFIGSASELIRSLTFSLLNKEGFNKYNSSTDGFVLNPPQFLQTDLDQYRTEGELVWLELPKFGNNEIEKNLAGEVWGQASFSEFRAFASFPVLYRVDRNLDSECVWFTDLRYILPFMTAPFRYGMCRQTLESGWQLFRLPRDTANDRQLIQSLSFIDNGLENAD